MTPRERMLASRGPLTLKIHKDTWAEFERQVAIVYRNNKHGLNDAVEMLTRVLMPDGSSLIATLMSEGHNIGIDVSDQRPTSDEDVVTIKTHMTGDYMMRVFAECSRQYNTNPELIVEGLVYKYVE